MGTNNKDNKSNLDYQFNRIIGETLKEHRIKKGFSLEGVCKKMKYRTTRQTINKAERNLSRVKLPMFLSICSALGEKPSDVLEEISLKYLKYVELNKDNYNNNLQ